MPFIITAALIEVVTLSGSQQRQRLSESHARQAARLAALAAANDPEAFNIRFGFEAQKLNATFASTNGVSLFTSEAVAVQLVGQAAMFRNAAGERVRKMEPLDAMPWPPGDAIVVNVRTINSLDYEKVVVTRNGVAIAALSSSLAPRELQTRMGARVLLHEGLVMYPLGTFDADAEVVVTIIPAKGDNIRRVLSADELNRIS